MSARVHSVPGQTEGRRNTFLEWTSIILSSKLSLTCGSNVNYYKSVHHPIPILPDRIWNTKAVFKTNQYALLSVECRGMFSFWPKWRGEEGLFEGCKKVATLWDYPQDHLVVIRDESLYFCEIWNHPTPSLFFITSPYSKHCRTWISMINLWIDSKTCQK